MKAALVFAVILVCLSCPMATADIILTSGDIGPSDPTVMIRDNAGLLMTRTESWVISTVVIPYPSELVGEAQISVTVYFVPDSPDAGDVDFKVEYHTYGVGDEWNYGGLGSLATPPVVPVIGSDTRVYSQVFLFDNDHIPVNDLLRLNIKRDFYGDPADTYPTGVYLHAIKLEGASNNAAEEPVSLQPQPSILKVSPNPFGREAMITYELSEVGNVAIRIYDVQGRLVDRVERGTEGPGEHSFEWRAPDVGSGVYFVKVVVNGIEHTAKSLRIE